MNTSKVGAQLVGFFILLSLISFAQCPQPSGYGVDLLSSDGYSCRVYWNEVTSTQDIRYNVRIRSKKCSNDATCQGDWNYPLFDSDGPDGTLNLEYTFNNLQPGVEYQVHFDVICDGQGGGFGTHSQKFFRSPFIAPINLSVNNITITSFTANWKKIVGPEVEYSFSYRPEGGGEADWVTITDIPTNSYTVTGLMPGQQYEWRVQTEYKFDNSKKSGWSNITNATTGQLITQGVAINITENAPDASAMLDVSSDNKGVLITRLMKSEREGIFQPAQGLLIFQTDNTPGFYYYDGTAWLRFVTVAE